MTGSLTIVGSGIKAFGHMTLEAKAYVENADKLLALVADPFTFEWLKSLNETAESLYRFYDPTRVRLETYAMMTDYIMKFVRDGMSVCVLFYGHPAVFVFPAHEARIIALREGYDVTVLPAVSAEDCLFADLGIDPGRSGCQSYEATDFLIYERIFDPRSVLVLWQVGVVGQVGFNVDHDLAKSIRILRDSLLQHYPETHKAIVYEAAQYVVCDPVIETFPLGNLESTRLSPISTLIVPPLKTNQCNRETARSIGVPEDYLHPENYPATTYDSCNPVYHESLRNQ